MTKRLIYIDIENIGLKALKKAANLSASDKIILFVNESDTMLRTHICYELSHIKSAVEILTFRSREKNALDFNICSSIGLLSDKNKEIYIVSKDKGYRSATEFFRNNGINVHLIGDIEELLPEHKHESETLRHSIESALSSAGIKLYTKKQIKKCEKILNESTDKNIFHNALQEAFHTTINTAALYNCLLPFFREIKNAHM